MGMKWYLTVSLTGLSLIICDAQHLFMYLLAFLVSFYYVF